MSFRRLIPTAACLCIIVNAQERMPPVERVLQRGSAIDVSRYQPASVSAKLQTRIIPVNTEFRRGVEVHQRKGSFFVLIDTEQRLYWWRFVEDLNHDNAERFIQVFFDTHRIISSPSELAVFTATNVLLVIATSNKKFASVEQIDWLANGEFDRRGRRPRRLGFSEYDAALPLRDLLGWDFFLDPSESVIASDLRFKSIDRREDGGWDVVVTANRAKAAHLVLSKQLEIVSHSITACERE